jgi:hypothetical protein
MSRLSAKMLPAVLILSTVCAAASSAFTLREAPPIDLSESAGAAVRMPMNGAAGGGLFDGERSTSKAVLYSFLLPGLGQYYLGERNRAWTFFLTEGAIWTSFAVFQAQGHIRRDGYQDYALAFAGISGGGHSDDFYREIGDFDSSEEYELFIKSDGRSFTYPNSDYATIEEYFINNRFSDYEPWSWKSTEDREHYYSLRWGSRLAFRRSLYSLAAALGNRIFSAVYALRSSRSADAVSMNNAQQLHVTFDSYPDPAGNAQFGISLARDF